MNQEDLRRIIDARHYDPFTILGMHQIGTEWVIRVNIPGAEQVVLQQADQPVIQHIPYSDVFETTLAEKPETPYRVSADYPGGHKISFYDPYQFAPTLGEIDRHLFAEGTHHYAYRFMGAHQTEKDGITGVHFVTWAPNAERVSVVGDFNGWDGRCHPMQVQGGSGLWSLFIPGVTTDTLYKFEIRNRNHGTLHIKADPYGRYFEQRPATASIISDDVPYPWQDTQWLEERASFDWLHKAMSIYEVHLGSWQHNDDGSPLNYRDLAHRLVEYVSEQGFTHIELLPITEHPFDGSWGYQTTGYFAPTSRFGKPDDFRYFVDYCHQHGIGVFLDWVPAHYPKDAHGLAYFDGEALYEHADPRQGEHRDWGTLIFNYGRNEVRSFLLSSASYWLEQFHIDGLRVDAVASMLYLDYSREGDDWIPNQYGGRENLEAVGFLKQLNTITHQEYPGTYVMAEESTSWPMVSRPIEQGGLGFSMKWNMGWMNDVLEYMHKDPIYRPYHHNQLTFGLLYAFTENFILPFSHDEVVHGKSSMLNKMPGDDWQRFANLRLLYTFMFTYPGKKLLFMGNEFAHGNEWSEAHALDWHLLDYPAQKGVQRLVRDLNTLYTQIPALHRLDFEGNGFAWIDCDDAAHSIISYLRHDADAHAVIALNFAPQLREGYRLGVPEAGDYQVRLNSDSAYYWGSNTETGLSLTAEPTPWMNQPYSVVLNLPPLAGVILSK